VKTVTAILVADDDPDVCDLAVNVLKAELGAEARCARTGNLALEAIETAGFDLAIIDVNMAGISGYELARCAADRNIPTLLSSGRPDDAAKLKESDFPYLAKPFRTSELIDESAKTITHASENIRRIKASLARLAATAEGLSADLAETERLMNESKAILAGRPAPGSIPPEANAEFMPKPDICRWLARSAVSRRATPDGLQ
jgi:CheY-like chemotaxis protein